MTARISLCEVDGIAATARHDGEAASEPCDGAHARPRPRRASNRGTRLAGAHAGRRSQLVRADRIAPRRLNVGIANRVLHDHRRDGGNCRHTSALEPCAGVALTHTTPNHTTPRSANATADPSARPAGDGVRARQSNALAGARSVGMRASPERTRQLERKPPETRCKNRGCNDRLSAQLSAGETRHAGCAIQRRARPIDPHRRVYRRAAGANAVGVPDVRSRKIDARLHALRQNHATEQRRTDGQRKRPDHEPTEMIELLVSKSSELVRARGSGTQRVPSTTKAYSCRPFVIGTDTVQAPFGVCVSEVCRPPHPLKSPTSATLFAGPTKTNRTNVTVSWIEAVRIAGRPAARRVRP